MELDWKIQNGKITPPGIIVTVNNHKMHVYKKGDGTETLVFMAGSGTCCPTLDFKPIWHLLSEKYTIVVIEKAGYGWSETAKVSRDIDTMLNETRTALSLVNLHPPFILMPHSMSGIEALAWAIHFPDEVRAIIGLDAALPECYDQFKAYKAASSTMLYRLLLLCKHIGLLRLIAKVAEKQIEACGQFSEREISIYRHMFINNSFTENMIDEVKCCRNNVKKIRDLGYPKSIPYLSFISDGKEIGISNWRELLMEFVSHMQYGKYVTLDCGHYIHHHQPKTIALESEKFISSICNSNEKE